MEVIYEPHPVSPERKAELRAKGLKIVDARFKPEGEAPSPEPPTREAIAEMKREDVIIWLEANGVSAPKGKVEDLRARLAALLFPAQ